MAVAAVAIAAVSCSKEGTAGFKGEYSFKTGGTLSFREKDNPDAETSTKHLTAETGQMKVLEADRSLGKMIVTMNIISGDALVFNAEAKGKRITLEPVSRTVQIRHGTAEVTAVQAEVTVSGTGELYDRTIIFDLDYQGGYEFAGTEYEIVDSKVNCIAALNE